MSPTLSTNIVTIKSLYTYIGVYSYIIISLDLKITTILCAARSYRVLSSYYMMQPRYYLSCEYNAIYDLLKKLFIETDSRA